MLVSFYDLFLEYCFNLVQNIFLSGKDYYRYADTIKMFTSAIMLQI